MDIQLHADCATGLRFNANSADIQPAQIQLASLPTEVLWESSSPSIDNDIYLYKNTRLDFDIGSPFSDSSFQLAAKRSYSGEADSWLIQSPSPSPLDAPLNGKELENNQCDNNNVYFRNQVECPSVGFEKTSQFDY
jgi:hypothetical protein